MCGRYRLSRRKELLAQHFSADFADMDWEPRYNIAPTQPVPVVRRGYTGTLRASLMRWGLIPSWAADPAIGARTVNARSETVASKPSFRESLQKRRCLVPADGFYEWQRGARGKQPFCFEVGDGEIFAFAGLWDNWRGPDGQAIETCTILTTTPNDLLAGVHDRMPVILAPEHHDRWLDPSLRDAATAVTLLNPFASHLMRRYPVSMRVNLVANDGPECSAPVDLPAEPATLFD
ncbi:MAG: SOS response-associated peptidase [Acidobacteriia bacterium]|nr:SOS response-associated peptidase [Terriglobia bacterium]